MKVGSSEEYPADDEGQDAIEMQEETLVFRSLDIFTIKTEETLDDYE